MIERNPTELGIGCISFELYHSRMHFESVEDWAHKHDRNAISRNPTCSSRSTLLSFSLSYLRLGRMVRISFSFLFAIVNFPRGSKLFLFFFFCNRAECARKIFQSLPRGTGSAVNQPGKYVKKFTTDRSITIDDLWPGL